MHIILICWLQPYPLQYTGIVIIYYEEIGHLISAFCPAKLKDRVQFLTYLINGNNLPFIQSHYSRCLSVSINAALKLKRFVITCVQTIYVLKTFCFRSVQYIQVSKANLVHTIQDCLHVFWTRTSLTVLHIYTMSGFDSLFPIVSCEHWARTPLPAGWPSHSRFQSKHCNISMYKDLLYLHGFSLFFLYTPFILTAVILKFQGSDKGYYTYSNFEMSFRMLKNKNHEIYCKRLAQNHKWMFWLYMYTTCKTISSASYL